MSTRLRLWLVAILLLAFALRLARLGYQELRGDEAFGFFFTQQGYRAIIDQTLALDEPHPVASYFVLKAWQGAAGSSEFALRFVGAWFGVAAVALGARLARRLGLAARVSVGAALLGALSPYAIWHAQDARMYAMSLALNTAVIWLAVEALARRRWQWIAAYLVVAWLALHTHYFTAFVLVALTLFVAGRALAATGARRALVEWLTWNVLLVVAYLPWLSSSATILAGYSGNGDSPGFAAMATRALSVFAVGESVPAAQRAGWAGLLALLCALGTLRLWLGGPNARRALWLLACWGSVPVLLTWYGALERPIFNERYLIAAAPAFWLLAACALQPLPRPRAWLNGAAALLGALLVGGMALSLARHYNDPVYSKTRGWRPLAAHMLALGAGLPSDHVRYAQNYPDPTLWYYTGDVPHLVLPPAAADAAGAAREVAALGAAGLQRVILAAQPAPAWDADGAAQAALDLGYDRIAVANQAPWQVEVWARTAAALPARAETFGGALRLAGALVDQSTLTPGGVLGAQVDWQPVAPAAPHAVTLQLLGPDGALVAQQDSPLDLAQPTRAHYGILLPATLTSGAYRVILAVYDPAQPGTPRLRTQSSADAVELARLTFPVPQTP